MRKIAIVGKAATSEFAPWEDDELDIWSLPWATASPRAKLLFDVHHPDFKKSAEKRRDFNSHHNPDGVYVERTNSHKIPVLCHPLAVGTTFKNGVPFPYAEIKALLPRVYLDCSVSWMIGYAMLIGVKHLGFWGCHFMAKEEYRVQLPSVTWMIGLAEGRGMTVENCAGSPMLMSGYTAGEYGITPEFRFWKGV
jgi:hypothetical protein